MFNQQLGSKTTNEQLHCLCNHLSAFGGSIFVAPNPIDFDTVFIKFTKLGETKNVVVLATVCVITGIYFIGLVFARRADKNDDFKVSVNILSFYCWFIFSHSVLICHLFSSSTNEYAYKAQSVIPWWADKALTVEWSNDRLLGWLK